MKINLQIIRVLTSILILSISFAIWATDNQYASSVGMITTEKPNKIINVNMEDTMTINFNPPLQKINNQEVIRFIIKNNGKQVHEFVIADEQSLKKHREMMLNMPNMSHTESNAIILNPGETNEITWKFTGKDPVVFACNMPGHFEAGMFLKVPME